jgi:glycine/D-amino acid oxidase-like deaminating enzyme
MPDQGTPSLRAQSRHVDALIIGGGFYGCHVALILAKMGLRNIRIVEREGGLLRRASYVNQARVHNGYHYPRSLPTGISSRKNFGHFVEEHRFAIVEDVQMYYAIARHSRVTPSQFARFCFEVGAPCKEDRGALKTLFDPVNIEDCFAVTEYAFDAAAIATDLAKKLASANVDCRFGVTARVQKTTPTSVVCDTTEGEVEAGYVFNCTYADLEQVGVPIRNRVKKELAEIALIVPPPELAGKAVTVMDGPFFSSMPFPPLCCYSLTHVRYTPHMAWVDDAEKPSLDIKSRAEAMIRDSSRFMPSLRTVEYLRSIYELKAVLVKSEESDGRPILFERSEVSDRIYSVLGSKIDNIYDILTAIQQQGVLSA